MNCDLTFRAQESLRLAQAEAGRLGHGYVGSEHLLLGLMEEGQGVAARTLASAGLKEDMVRTLVSSFVGVGASGNPPSQGMTPRLRRIVELAAAECCRSGARYVGTGHLLAGILKEGDGAAARILGGQRHRPPHPLPGGLRLLWGQLLLPGQEAQRRGGRPGEPPAGAVLP
ncbi:MAG: hypothetical protein LUF84_08300 [Clostridiales bacterium]|nr:hypothetical protein [Clostridiales bacterium]